MTTSLLLYLVRHGQSEGNVVQYDVPDGNLTALGRAQAAEVGARLRGEAIDLVLSSPLRRALQTADAIRRATGAPHRVWRDLLEHRDTTPYRFHGKVQVLQVCPDAECEPGLADEGFDFGHESVSDAYLRAARVAVRVREEFAGTDMRVALVAHGGFNSFFLMALLGRPWAPGFWIEQQNCCLNRLRVTPGRVHLLSINETNHISEVT